MGENVARQQTQLVTQHLENISRKALEKYEEIVRQYVRRRHGIYALYRGNRLYYVGLASNLRSRLGQHLRDRHAGTWDRFSVYLTVSDGHLKELESLVLRIASPKGNRTKSRLSRSEDLRRQIRRQISRSLRAELKSLFEGVKAAVVSKTMRSAKPKGTLAPYIDRSRRIILRYKGRRYRARARTDGRIRFRGKLYNRHPLLRGRSFDDRLTVGLRGIMRDRPAIGYPWLNCGNE
jgi:hypothetical protein